MTEMLSLPEQTAIAEKWSLARRILPMVRDSFRSARTVTFDQSRWLFLMDVIENYLPRAIAQEETMSDSEQTQVLSYLSYMHRGKDVLRSRQHVSLILGLLLTATEYQERVLEYLKVEDGSGRASKD